MLFTRRIFIFGVVRDILSVLTIEILAKLKRRPLTKDKMTNNTTTILKKIPVLLLTKKKNKKNNGSIV